MPPAGSKSLANVSRFLFLLRFLSEAALAGGLLMRRSPGCFTSDLDGDTLGIWYDVPEPLRTDPRTQAFPLRRGTIHGIKAIFSWTTAS